MFHPNSKIETEDLYYAIITRQQVIEKMIEEVQAADQRELYYSLQNEQNRLYVIKHNIELHINDADGCDDCLDDKHWLPMD